MDSNYKNYNWTQINADFQDFKKLKKVLSIVKYFMICHLCYTFDR